MTAAPPTLRYPVILLHGMGGFDQIRIELIRRYPVQIDYFKGIARILTDSGVPRVYTAALPPTGSIRQRAEALRKFIKHQVAEPKFHLVAHSMGGLDSRHYLAHLDGAGRAISLTTVGTPHRGSPIATLALEAFFDPCASLIEKLGAREPLRRLHQRTAAHRDLRPESCAQFNAVTPDVPGVAYFSYGGAPPVDAVQWIMRIPFEILKRMKGGGPNDGLVPLESARWTGWRGELAADHISLTGWQLTSSARRRFHPRRFYQSLLKDLAASEERNAWDADDTD